MDKTHAFQYFTRFCYKLLNMCENSQLECQFKSNSTSAIFHTNNFQSIHKFKLKKFEHQPEYITQGD